jgi:hypothetical protein
MANRRQVPVVSKSSARKKPDLGAPERADSPVLATVRVAVVGDVQIDAVLMRMPRDPDTNAHENWRRGDSYLEFRRLGGAALLAEMLAEPLSSTRILSYSRAAMEPFLNQLHPPLPLSIATIHPFPRGGASRSPGDTRGRDDEFVYRLSREGARGWMSHRAAANAGLGTSAGPVRQPDRETLAALASTVVDQCSKTNAGDTVSPQLVVIHDHNNGFRDLAEPDLMDRLLDSKHFVGESGRGVILWHRDHPMLGNGTPVESSPNESLSDRESSVTPSGFVAQDRAGTGDGKASSRSKDHLWNRLVERYARRIVLILNASDLREHGININDDLSIERIGYDFLAHLRRPPLNEVTKCAYVLVRFENGVLIYGRNDPSDDSRSLLRVSYLPASGNSGRAAGGYVVGNALLLMTAIIQAIHASMQRIAEPGDQTPWTVTLDNAIRQGAEVGIAYGRMHFREGFLPRGFASAKQWSVDPPRGGGSTSVTEHDKAEAIREVVETWSPYKCLLREWQKRREEEQYGHELTVATLELETSLQEAATWSRVNTLTEPHDDPSPRRPMVDVGVEVVRHGLKRVIRASVGLTKEDWAWLPGRQRCPYWQMGDLQLIDREEIDSFAGVAGMVTSYLHSAHLKEPLCLAVFGPPGSGKSFAVRQLLQHVRSGSADKPLEREYNLSQFNDVTDLATAFHQVQDAALGGNVPLVVFDEFDTRLRAEKLGWLKYFLAPMQDGKYRVGETIYQVGRAILVFAGGTHHTFESFYSEAIRDREAFVSAKGPDFVSRLRGHLNINGINPKRPETREIDDLLILRRAILLRHFLERHTGVVDAQTKVARIDEDVLRAFLLTPLYEHGVRSMEAIVKMSLITAIRGGLQKASLPLQPQLAMHVDAHDFLKRVNQARG